MSIITAHELHTLAARHTPDPDLPDLCAECDGDYPCPTKRLIIALAAELGRRLYAERQATRHAPGLLTLWLDVPEPVRRDWIARATAFLTRQPPPPNIVPFTPDRRSRP